AMSVVVEVVGLRREWPLPKGPPVVAVADASFTVSAGEVLGLLGPNGAGKTTIMQVLATLTPPTAGVARVAGYDVATDASEVRKRLGYLSTTSGLPARLTVEECLGLFARLHGLADAPRAVAAAVERFRLGDFRHRFAEGLSTGMRQRLRIACAAIHRPPVLILDEPTSGLDLMSTDDLLDEVLALRAEGAGVLYSTHVMEEAERICDRVAVLHQGRVRATATVAALRAETGAVSLAEAFRRTVRG
ncbi:MAG: ABC transporter ATP-binding protein, partial [Myxococcota bacterium]